MKIIPESIKKRMSRLPQYEPMIELLVEELDPSEIAVSDDPISMGELIVKLSSGRFNVVRRVNDVMAGYEVGLNAHDQSLIGITENALWMKFKPFD